MNISALQPQPAPRAVDIPLERLAGNAALTEAQKLGETARQFESLLVRQILAETQKTVIKSKLNEDSTANSIYRDLLTTQLAEDISKSGKLGLTQSLEQQLGRQSQPASLAGNDHSTAALPTALSGSDVARPTISDTPPERFSHRHGSPAVAFTAPRP